MPPASQDALARIAPFAVYVALLVAESLLPERAFGRWLYLSQIALSAVLLAALWPRFSELHRPGDASLRDWGLGALTGLVVFVLWINLDFGWAQFGDARGVGASVTGEGADALGLAARFVGAVAVVPLLEELFWRSFLMRWLDKAAFLEVSPRYVSVRSLLICSVVFALEHHLWLSGLVAGLAYGWLYRRLGLLWPVVLAHAVTNLLLEIWVQRTAAWHFL